MSRAMYKNDYHKTDSGCLLPIRWMAWESLLMVRNHEIKLFVIGTYLHDIYKSIPKNVTYFVGQVHNKVGRLGIWGYLMGNINLCSRTTLWKSKWCKSLVKFVKYVARRPSDGGLVDPSRMPKGSSRSDDRMLATRRPRTTFISRDSFVSSKKKFGI